VLLVLAGLSWLSYDDLVDGRSRDLGHQAPAMQEPIPAGKDVFWQTDVRCAQLATISVIAAAVSGHCGARRYGGGIRRGFTGSVLMFISDGLLVIPLFLIIVLMAMLVWKRWIS
jgi:peptide/nickel transport system permease protein